MRKKFVKRRVKKAYCYRKSFHDFKDLPEITLLHRKEFGERFLSSPCIISENHFPDSTDPLRCKKHVFCPAQANPLSPEFSCNRGIMGCI